MSSFKLMRLLFYAIILSLMILLTLGKKIKHEPVYYVLPFCMHMTLQCPFIVYENFFSEFTLN